MPTFWLPVIPNCPVVSIGKPCFQLVRVKPMRTEFSREGEKVCTQLAPVTLVGYRLIPGNVMGSTAIDPLKAVEIEKNPVILSFSRGSHSILISPWLLAAYERVGAW